MRNSDIIEHSGRVVSIDGSHIRVNIIQQSACSSCKAKSLCTSSEQKDKVIDVFADNVSDYSVGQDVVVCGTLSMGKAAVRIAFLYPLLIIVAVVGMTRVGMHFSELLSVACAFVSLIVYFTLVYSLRERFRREFAFWIKH